MSKHTPGPWFVDAEHAGLFEQDQARFWINASGTHVAYVDGPRNDERTANARLIAAAPELLEFAEEVRRTGDTRLASMAIAVIAKAIGEAK